MCRPCEWTTNNNHWDHWSIAPLINSRLIIPVTVQDLFQTVDVLNLWRYTSRWRAPRIEQSTGLRSGELDGQFEGSIKSGTFVCKMAKMACARIHTCPHCHRPISMYLNSAHNCSYVCIRACACVCARILTITIMILITTMLTDWFLALW